MATSARDVVRYILKARLQNKLQSMAVKLDRAKAAEGKASAKVEAVKGMFYQFANEAYGPDTYVIYEGRGPLLGKRMSRVIQEPREFDIDKLREMLPVETFIDIISESVDASAFDNAVSRRKISNEVIDACVTYGRKPILTWQATGPRSGIPLDPGQVAVVGPVHVAVEA